MRAKKVRVRQQSRESKERSVLATETRVASPSLGADLSLPNQEILGSEDVTFNQIFSYASFMWDECSPPLSPGWNSIDCGSSSQELIPWSDASLSVPLMSAADLNSTLSSEIVKEKPQTCSPVGSARLACGWSESQLAEYFSRSSAPPILATVETSARWLWMRKELTSMTSTSRMVRSGVIAFVALELELTGSLEPASHSQYYQSAKQRLGDCLKEISKDRKIIISQLRNILAVLFLLSYIDLLTKDVSKAHANLRDGFNALQMVDVDSLGVTGETFSSIYLRHESHVSVRKANALVAASVGCSGCKCWR